MNTFVDLPSQINKYIIHILNRTWTHFSFIRTAICSHLDRDARTLSMYQEMRVPFHAYARESFRSYQILSPSPLSFSLPLRSLPTFEQTETLERNSNHPVLQHFIILFCFLTGRFFKKKSGNKDFKKGFQEDLESRAISETNRILYSFYGFIWIIKCSSIFGSLEFF